MTLNEKMCKWLTQIKAKEVGETTLKGMFGIARNYIFPMLGHLPLFGITQAEISNCLDSSVQKDGKVIYETQLKCKRLLRDFFDYCIYLGELKNNPVKDIAILPPQEKNVLSIEATQRLFEALDHSRFWKPFCMTLIDTGMRRGEILALRWCDIDFIKKRIALTETIAYSKVKPCKLKKRRIKISNELTQTLESYRNYRKRYSYNGEMDFVFGNDKGESYSYGGINRSLKRFFKRKGLTGIDITVSAIRNIGIFRDVGIEQYRANYLNQRLKKLTNKEEVNDRII